MIEPATDEQVAQWLKMYAYVPPGHGGFEGRRIQTLLARIEADGKRIAELVRWQADAVPFVRLGEQHLPYGGPEKMRQKYDPLRAEAELLIAEAGGDRP